MLRGTLQPRVLTCPPGFTRSAGQDVVDLAASAGVLLDPWQALVLDAAMRERPDVVRVPRTDPRWGSRRWNAFEVGLLVARQNGKGEVLLARELAGLFLFNERLILHSAHEFKTAQEAFLRLKAVIDNTDWMRRKVKTIRTSHGEEGVELTSGQRLRFVARSRSSGRGFTGDLNLLDEAQELPQLAVQALLPTMSAVPNPQLWYTGTVPTPENDADVWTRVRDRGRAGTSNRLCWIEWSPGDTWPGMHAGAPCPWLDDRQAWCDGNPALGIRLDDEFIEGEREAMDDDGFARERLSVWPPDDPDADTVIPMSLWDDNKDPASEPIDPVAFAVDMPPTRKSAAIGVSGLRSDGLLHVGVVEQRPGNDWVAPRLGELVRKWRPRKVVVDPRSPAGALIPDIESYGVEVHQVTASEYAQACGFLYDRTTSQRIRHRGQPVLDDALRGATQRPIADAWGWNRRDASVDISPLVAVTLAAFAFVNTPDTPEVEPWGFIT